MDSRISGNMMYFTNLDANCLTHTGSICLFSSIIDLENIDLENTWLSFGMGKMNLSLICLENILSPKYVNKCLEDVKHLRGSLWHLFQDISEGGREDKLSLWAVPYGFYRNPSCMVIATY